MWLKVEIRILIPPQKIKHLTLRNEHRIGQRLRLNTGSTWDNLREVLQESFCGASCSGEEKTEGSCSARVTSGLAVVTAAVTC